jgi:hypothetical protein
MSGLCADLIVEDERGSLSLQTPILTRFSTHITSNFVHCVLNLAGQPWLSAAPSGEPNAFDDSPFLLPLAASSTSPSPPSLRVSAGGAKSVPGCDDALIALAIDRPSPRQPSSSLLKAALAATSIVTIHCRSLVSESDIALLVAVMDALDALNEHSADRMDPIASPHLILLVHGSAAQTATHNLGESLLLSAIRETSPKTATLLFTRILDTFTSVASFTLHASAARSAWRHSEGYCLATLEGPVRQCPHPLPPAPKDSIGLNAEAPWWPRPLSWTTVIHLLCIIAAAPLPAPDLGLLRSADSSSGPDQSRFQLFIPAAAADSASLSHALALSVTSEAAHTALLAYRAKLATVHLPVSLDALFAAHSDAYASARRSLSEACRHLPARFGDAVARAMRKLALTVVATSQELACVEDPHAAHTAAGSALAPGATRPPERKGAGTTQSNNVLYAPFVSPDSIFGAVLTQNRALATRLAEETATRLIASAKSRASQCHSLAEAHTLERELLGAFDAQVVGPSAPQQRYRLLAETHLLVRAAAETQLQNLTDADSRLAKDLTRASADVLRLRENFQSVDAAIASLKTAVASARDEATSSVTAHAARASAARAELHEGLEDVRRSVVEIATELSVQAKRSHADSAAIERHFGELAATLRAADVGLSETREEAHAVTRRVREVAEAAESVGDDLEHTKGDLDGLRGRVAALEDTVSASLARLLETADAHARESVDAAAYALRAELQATNRLLEGEVRQREADLRRLAELRVVDATHAPKAPIPVVLPPPVASEPEVSAQDLELLRAELAGAGTRISGLEAENVSLKATLVKVTRALQTLSARVTN